MKLIVQFLHSKPNRLGEWCDASYRVFCRLPDLHSRRLAIICMGMLIFSSMAAFAQRDAAKVPPSAPVRSNATIPPRTAAAPGGLTSYKLKPGDTVKLFVLNEPDLASEQTIDSSGQVSFALINSVTVAGRTQQQAEKLIADAYNKDFLVDPKVTFTVVSSMKQTVTVSGAVVTPGASVPIPESGQLDVLAAIAAAGGSTDKADLRKVRFRSASGGSSELDVIAMQENPALSRLLKHGDTLTIPVKIAKFVNVGGQVSKPGQIEITEEDGRLDLITAITKAGDFTRIANRKKVSIRRLGRKDPIVVNAAAMADGNAPLFYLEPGDTVSVKEAIF